MEDAMRRLENEARWAAEQLKARRERIEAGRDSADAKAAVEGDIRKLVRTAQEALGETPEAEREVAGARRVHQARTEHWGRGTRADAHMCLAALDDTDEAAAQRLERALETDTVLPEERTRSVIARVRAEGRHPDLFDAAHAVRSAASDEGQAQAREGTEGGRSGRVGGRRVTSLSEALGRKAVSKLEGGTAHAHQGYDRRRGRFRGARGAAAHFERADQASVEAALTRPWLTEDGPAPDTQRIRESALKTAQLGDIALAERSTKALLALGRTPGYHATTDGLKAHAQAHERGESGLDACVIAGAAKAVHRRSEGLASAQGYQWVWLGLGESEAGGTAPTLHGAVAEALERTLTERWPEAAGKGPVWTGGSSQAPRRARPARGSERAA